MEKVGYGLERSLALGVNRPGPANAGEEYAAGIFPKTLFVSPEHPKRIYASAGASGNGNRTSRPYTGPLTGGGVFYDSMRLAHYDMNNPGEPEATDGTAAEPADAQVDRLFAVLNRYLPAGSPLPDIALTPDSMDVAALPGQVLVANGEAGLAVLNPSDLKELGAAKFGVFGEAEYATRLLPTPIGSLGGLQRHGAQPAAGRFDVQGRSPRRALAARCACRHALPGGPAAGADGGRGGGALRHDRSRGAALRGRGSARGPLLLPFEPDRAASTRVHGVRRCARWAAHDVPRARRRGGEAPGALLHP